jgi:photosystem II stability/assembly factor-like uncharacterized protein
MRAPAQRWLRLTFVLALGLLGVSLAAQTGAPPAQTTDPMLRNMAFRNLGNANLIGRISAVDALDDDWSYVVVGSAAGGVLKSENGGTSWTPIFDTYSSASIGDVKINQKDKNLIWVGTGEGHQRNTAAWGDGVYKSTDGGKTFENVGLKDTYNIGRIRLHPTNKDIVYVAALGNIWAPTGNRGLYKTIDGGKTWTKLTNGLPNSQMTGADGLVMDPTNPEILYVSFWDRIRYPWGLISGGNTEGVPDPMKIVDGSKNGGIYKSVDGGKTWKKLTVGLPTMVGRIGLAIAKTNPKILMAHVEADYQPECGGGRGGGRGRGGAAAAAGGGAGAAGAAGQAAAPPAQPAATPGDPGCNDLTKLGAGMYRSEDGGLTWKLLDRYLSRPFYYMQVQMSPLNDQEVFSYTINYRRSHDGGKTWIGGGGGQGMHCWHAMWFDPHNKNRYYIASDGGLALTHDDGETSLRFTNINVTQYYDITANNADPYWVCGGLQDAGSSCGPSQTRASGIYTSDWINTGGGDGFHTAMDPSDPRIVYSESQPDQQGGNIGRFNLETGQRSSIRPNKQNITNWDEYITPEMEKTAADRNWGTQPQNAGPLRFNWSTPYYISPHNPQTLFIGANHLLMTTDRGQTYRIISPDLTSNDPQKTVRKSGGLTPDENPGGGAEYHCTIITLAESTIEPGNIWVGTDDGNVQVTRNYGATWSKVGSAGFPGVGRGDVWVSRVEPSHSARGTAYVSLDGHRYAINKPYIFKTTDYGKTWTSLSNNLPEGPIYVVKEDLKNPNLLFAGSEFAAYYSLDGGAKWNRLNTNLPTVAVTDIMVHPRDNDLLVSTMGHGLYVLDDITPLQQMTSDAMKEDAKLFENRVATEWLSVQPQHTGGQLAFIGPNPTRDAVINYYLSDRVTGEVRFDVTDPEGKNSCTATITAQSGIGRMLWGMRWPTPAGGGGGRGGRGGGGAAGAGQAAAAGGGAGGAGAGGPGAPGFGGGGGACMMPAPTPGVVAGGGGRGGGGGGFGGGGGAGRVPAGTYKVTMTAGGKTYTSTITVRQDPLLKNEQ